MRFALAQAPSNIALIKYMGKICHEKNLPANPSFSYTLPDLYSTVRLSLSDQDHWQALDEHLTLNEKSQKRFIDFFQKIKKHFNISEHFCIQSSNNFPQGTGIASSASSFAALLLATNQAFSELKKTPLLSHDRLAPIARLGSGSAIRSFYAPWAIWENETARKITLPYDSLIHQVILIDKTEKSISSSKAHQLVESSPLYQDRLNTVRHRLDKLLQALSKYDWGRSYVLVREEFLEMHALFSSARSVFSYLKPESKQIIDDIEKLWKNKKDGPIITMDAGPNVHLLYRPDQNELANQIKENYERHFHVL